MIRPGTVATLLPVLNLTHSEAAWGSPCRHIQGIPLQHVCLSETQIILAKTNKESITFLLQGILCHSDLHLCEFKIKLL